MIRAAHRKNVKNKQTATATIAQIMSNKKNRTQKTGLSSLFREASKKKRAADNSHKKKRERGRERLKRFCVIQQQLFGLYKLLLLLLLLLLILLCFSFQSLFIFVAWKRFRVVAISSFFLFTSLYHDIICIFLLPWRTDNSQPSVSIFN